MTQRVAVKTTATAVAVSPLARWLRTIVAAVVGFGAAEPTLIGLVHLTGTKASEVSAIVAALVAVVSGAQNLAEKLGLVPVVGGKAPATPVASKPAAPAA